MVNNIKAAIFDMDGTLIDSMWVWDKIDFDFLNKRGFEVPHNLKDEISPLTYVDTAKYFKKRFKLDDSIEDIVKCWNDMAFNEYKKNVGLKPGAYEFLDLLKSKGLKIGLATSNLESIIEMILKKNNIYDYFDCITTEKEVGKSKTSPDIYLASAKKLNVEPEECIVFEDILPAVLSAKKIGMKVVGIQDSYSDFQRDKIVQAADKFISDFNELM